MLIRAAGPLDIPHVAGLYRDWEDEGITIGLRADSEAELVVKLKDWFFVACDGAEIVGFVTGITRTLRPDEWVAMPSGGDFLSIEDLYVARGWRRRGVGSALMRQLLRTASGAGVQQVAIYSSSQPWRQIVAFYESLGLTVWFVQLVGSTSPSVDRPNAR